MQTKLRRIVSLLSAAALTAAIAIEPVSQALPYRSIASITASAADAVHADTMKIYDNDGNDISRGMDSYIYLDNSTAAKGTTSTNVTVEISRKDSAAFDDTIYYVLESGQKLIEVESVQNTGKKLKLNIKANEKVSGTTNIVLSSKSGEVFRKLFVVVYNPSTDISVKCNNDQLTYEKYIMAPKEYSYDGSEEQFKAVKEQAQRDYNAQGASDTLMKLATISNHQYQMSASLTSVNGKTTDQVQWKLFKGAYYPGIEKQANPEDVSSIAELSSTGMFTPKSNGTVTIMAKAKPVLPYQCKETMSEEGATISDFVNSAYTETFQRLENWRAGRTAQVNAVDPSGKKRAFTVTYDDKTMVAFIQVNIIKENPAKEIIINNAPLGLQLDESFQIDYDLTPTFSGSEYTGATDVIRFETSNKNVATVDSKGYVTAVGKGEVTITAYAENENVKANCNLRVYSKVSSISVSPSPISTRVGIPVTLTATLSPDSAEDEVEWSSSDPDVAVVSVEDGQFGSLKQKCTVTGGTKSGTATITARAKYSGVETTCLVTVTDKIVTDTLDLSYLDDAGVRQYVTDGEVVDLFNTRKLALTADLLAADGSSTTDDKVLWSIEGNGDDIVTFDTNFTQATVTGNFSGQVTIKAYSEANPTISKRFKVNVIRKCDTVSITSEDNLTTINKGQTVQLTANLTTKDSTAHNDYIRSWESSDPSTATVSSSGLVTFHKANTQQVTITAYAGSYNKTEAPNQKSTISLKGIIPSSIFFTTPVTPQDGTTPVQTIQMTKNASGGLTGTPVSLRCSVMDSSTTTYTSGTRIEWTSSDPSVATIDDTGKVTPVAIGETTITARTASRVATAIVKVVAGSNAFTVTMPAVKYSPFETAYTPVPTITMQGNELVYGTDFDVSYNNNTKVGQSATYTVTYKGEYAGSPNYSSSFAIQTKPVNDSDIAIEDIPRQKLTGEMILPEVNITYMGVKLVKDVDYTISGGGRSVTPSAYVSIMGKGNYSASVNKTFEIYCAHSKVDVLETTKQPTCTEPGKGSYRCKLCNQLYDDVSIPALGHDLPADWTIDKQATCTERGSKSKHCKRCNQKCNETAIPALGHEYVSTVTPATYTTKGFTTHVCKKCNKSYVDNETPMLVKPNLSKAAVTVSPSSTIYNGSPKTPNVTVTIGGKKLTMGTDYTVTYANNTQPGTATVEITGRGEYEGTVKKNFTIRQSLSKATVSAAGKSYKYSGKNVYPALTVSLDGKTLKKGTDYTVAYKNNKNTGKASLTISGIGKYSGSKTVSYYIVPKAAKISKVKASGKKKIVVKWKKDAQASGYEVTIATNKKFTSGTKTATIKKNKTVSKTFKKLKKGKTYYAKVRSFKTIDGKKYYGGYSAAKKVKCK